MQKSNFNEEKVREKYKDLFAYSLDFIYVHDLRGRFIDANDNALETLGYTRAEIKNISFLDLIDNEQIKRAFATIKEIQEHGKQLSLREFQLKKKDGKLLYLEVYTIPLKDNEKIYGLLGIGKDITIKKEALLKLHESEQKLKELNSELEKKINERTIELKNSKENYKKINKEFELILDNIPASIFYKDSSNKFIRINKYGADAQKLSKQEMEGKSCFELFPKEQALKYWEDDLEVIRNKKAKLNFEELWETQYGQKWVQTSKFPIINDKGEIDGIIGFSIDITEQKKRENDLKENEYKFRVLYENAPNAYFSIGTDKAIKRCNKAATILLGYSEEEFLKMQVFDLYAKTPNGLEKAQTLFQRFMKGEPIQNEELEMKHKEGEVIWVSFSVNPIIEGGKIVASRSSVVNITKIKQSEKLINETKEYYENIVQNLNDQVVILNEKFEYEYINEKITQKISGYSNEDLIGKSALIFVHPDDVNDGIKILSKGFKEGEGKHTYRFKHKDGRWIWLESRGKTFVDSFGKLKGLLISRDVSDIRLAQESLKLSEERYRNVIENIQEGYYEVDLYGNFTFFNDSFVKIMGCSYNDLFNKNFKDFFDKETSNLLEISSNEVYKSKREITNLELLYQAPNRNLIYLETSFYIRTDSNGKVIGFKGFVRNITERKHVDLLRQQFSQTLENEVVKRTKELQEALNQQKQMLDQIVKSSQFKTEFMATMSHELRTPLNAIIGFTDLLLEGAYGPLTEDQIDFLRDIKSSAEHQFEMIQQILDITKIEAGQLKLNLQKFSLNTLIDQIVSTLKPMYTKKKLELEVKGLTEEKEIFADSTRLKEIFFNLLTNAIKFSMSGKISLKIQQKYNEWIFSVFDTGIGIAEKDFDIIFKEFKRVESTYVRSVPGTGLGLSLTKRLVNLHGGEIKFTSALGVGSIFTFTIPIKQEFDI